MKNQRQDELLKMLMHEQSLKIGDLASHFNVSVETIRRDINVLSQAGLVKKMYGGVSLATDAMRMVSLNSWNTRRESNQDCKIRIAACAADMIQDNTVIAIDSGSTIYELSRLLGTKKNLSVVTNNLIVAADLAQNTSHRIYCMGGMVEHQAVATSGMFTRLVLDRFAVIDLYIGSADGLTIKSGIMECDEPLVEVKRELIRRSKKRIALVDHSKFGKEALFASWAFDEIDVLITDEKAPVRELDAIRQMGVQVIVAP